MDDAAGVSGFPRPHRRGPIEAPGTPAGRQPGDRVFHALISVAPLKPPEPQPAGSPVIDLEIEGSPLVIRATLNGKSVRRALKVVADHGAEGVNALLQGNLKPAPSEGGPWILDTAGLAVTPKVAKPEAPGPSESAG
jgi:hypothetical protein